MPLNDWPNGFIIIIIIIHEFHRDASLEQNFRADESAPLRFTYLTECSEV